MAEETMMPLAPEPLAAVTLGELEMRLPLPVHHWQQHVAQRPQPQ